MEPNSVSTLITAFAAVAGSIVGGMTSFATTYFVHRNEGRRERLADELAKREALYGQFVQEAVAVYVDSLDRSLENPARLVGLFATIARIRLVGSEAILAAAEAVGRDVIASYKKTKLTPEEFLRGREESEFEPFKAFALACREELDSLRGRL